MATPLGITFSTDKQIVAQGDVISMGRTVESLIVEFNQAKYEEFLSSSSKNPKARLYCKVSSGIRSRVLLETSSNAIAVKSAMAGRITREAHVNVSLKTREASVVESRFGHALPLPQLQVTRGSQQPIKRNRNAERRQK